MRNTYYILQIILSIRYFRMFEFKNYYSFHALLKITKNSLAFFHCKPCLKYNYYDRLVWQ